MKRLLVAAAWPFSFVPGCGDDSTSSNADTTDTGVTDGTMPTEGTDVDPTASAGPSTGDSGSSSAEGLDGSEGAFDPSTPECGNGYLEADEQCDDGNRRDGDGCDAGCTVPCGLVWSVQVPAPTAASDISGIAVAAAEDGTSVVAATLQEVTTDPEGNRTVAPTVVRVLGFDVDGVATFSGDVALAEHDVEAVDVVLDAAGDAVVIGTANGASGRRIVLAKVSGADGSIPWQIEIDGLVAEADDFAEGVAVTAEGDVIASATLRVGDGDDDVWIGRFAGLDGEEQWTATHSSPIAPNGFSVDDGGPVAIAGDGTIWVGGSLYEDFDTSGSVLVRWLGDGTPLGVTPLPVPPGTQIWSALALTPGPDDGVVFADARLVGGEPQVRITRFSAEAAVAFELEAEAFAPPTRDDFAIRAITTLPGELAVAGVVERGADGVSWTEAFAERRVIDDGTPTCRIDYGVPSRRLLPPSLDIRDAAGIPDGGLLLTGRVTSEVEPAVWLGRFRPAVPRRMPGR
jgi:cysteine-rich repeat protein